MDYSIAKQLFYDIRRCATAQNATVYGGIGGAVDRIANIRHSYRDAYTALKYISMFSENEVIHISDIQNKGATIKCTFDSEAFITGLKLADRVSVLDRFDDFFMNDVSLAGKADYLAFELTLMHELNAALIALLEVDVQAYETLSQRHGSLFAQIESADSREMVRIARTVIVEILEAIEQSRELQNVAVIEKAKRYILDNYKRDFTLNDIAKAVSLSKNYLGQLFKQKTGLHIIEYLHRIRISKAKELVENTNMKVYEIADALGYNDQPYFSAIFKRIVGVTPTEYREFSSEKK